MNTLIANEAKCRLVVSFVLYNTDADEVRRAVAQVLDTPVDARVVIVDNSPVALPEAAPADGRVTQIFSGANLGYGAGHNRAMALAKGWAPYHLVVNTDLAFGPEALPALLAFMDAHPDVGLAMPRVSYPDGRRQYLCRLLPHPLDVFGRGFMPGSRWTARRNDRYENRRWSHAVTAEFPFLSGCFMLLRNAVLGQTGGFDERFFMYGEDADLSRRVNAVSRTVFAPVADVVHEYRSEGGGIRRLLYKVVNLTRYFNKWGWFFDRERTRINERTLGALNALQSPIASSAPSARR